MKVINFPTDKIKEKVKEESLDEVLDIETVIDYVIAGMVQEIIPTWILNHWSFRELDHVVEDMRNLLRKNAPERVTRRDLSNLMTNLKGTWITLAESIRTPE